MFTRNNNRKRFHEAKSDWLRSFSLTGIKCLIVCRGPVRKEAMDVFDEIGIAEYGILLSEKDSIVYTLSLAPELRNFRFPHNIHRVPDYMGAGAEEKKERIEQIINIAKDNKYTHIFAGYGFMAEDAEFIEAIEKSGVTFMGPASYVARQAGAKDEAKKLARKLDVSVTPGIDNITALTLLAKVKDKAGLEQFAKDNGIHFEYNNKVDLAENAEALLQIGYSKGLDLITIPELQEEAEKQIEEIWKKYAGYRVRLKYIGGGGGKGQRIVREKDEIKNAVMEILAESKVITQGSNRNFLIELNIENTRHNEIQLIGNGEWSLSLGGRDCSLQMHEQKLLEISFTKEMMEQEIAHSHDPIRRATLQGDLKALIEMEEQSERFGAAVKLDSVSTFESIVEGTNHFFMEMNTRIQVEHRVTEMAYRLKFTNPNDKKDYFYIDSLIEAMALISVHGKRVPKPERIVRNISGGEVRINATNPSLQPHAGGLIQNWSPALPFEIRDDQGIGVKNPDTGMFIHYKVSGAYDSNIALIVSYGKSRKENLDRLSEILRRTELRGHDLQTNMQVHYGLINWILGKDVMFKPSTRFMLSYLAAVGSLQTIIRDFDIEILWESLYKKNATSPAAAKIMARKLTYISRPIKEIMKSPHLLAGFIGYHHKKSWKVENDEIVFLRNPIEILADLYNYINFDRDDKKAPSHQIWDHDYELQSKALAFYKDLEKTSGLKESYSFWASHLSQNSNPVPSKISNELWAKCVAAHKGHQLGLDILKVFPKIAMKSGFVNLDIDNKLDPIIPEEFMKTESVNYLIKQLAPPPKAKSDEIIAPMGGMFYSKEAPHLPAMINEGDRFNAGQPLFIIEVMKMFNKIVAPFSGTIVKSFLPNSDGKIVQKGQLVFKVQPDEIVKEETPEEISQRRKQTTLSLI